MGQSCSQNCGHLNGLAAAGGCGLQYSGSGLGSGAAAPRPLAAPLRHGVADRREEEAEECPPIHATAFQVSVVHGTDRLASASRQGWKSSYALGKLLGDGISAKVFEAEALTSDGVGSSLGSRDPPGLLGATCGGVDIPRCFREKGRKVAIKRFHRVGSRTFQKELWALRRVGVHPHVLRLLESHQGHEGEDVLVLEYCDGATLYDLYAREHPNGGLPERLVARFVRQLLQALEHLALCGVEHQDVKPENMMLYDVSVAASQGELKLGDFGWAAILPWPTPKSGSGSPAALEAAAKLSKLPATGAGSLWYAPPELNPPVQGLTLEGGPPLDSSGELLRGRSDMWSVGVVLYLLLVGHNPFNLALKQTSQEAVDAEVMRLAALGKYNKSSEKWKQLHVDASDFISVMLRVKPCARPSAAEALHHPFLLRRTAKTAESSVFFNGEPVVPASGDRDRSWTSLDGLQRMAWVAVARAVSEAELDRSIVSAAAEAAARPSTSGPTSAGDQDAYLWHLARELAAAPVLQWLQERGAWADVVRMAFCYLDLDCDGLLSPQDLSSHMSAVPAREGEQSPCQGTAWYDRDEGSAASGGNSFDPTLDLCSRWVARWQDPDSPPAMTTRGTPGLPLVCFREALLASHSSGAPLFGGAFDAPLSGRGVGPSCDYSPGSRPTSAAAAAAALAVARLRRKPTGHDEEEISWTDMVLQGSAA